MKNKEEKKKPIVKKEMKRMEKWRVIFGIVMLIPITISRFFFETPPSFLFSVDNSVEQNDKIFSIVMTAYIFIVSLTHCISGYTLHKGLLEDIFGRGYRFRAWSLSNGVYLFTVVSLFLFDNYRLYFRYHYLGCVVICFDNILSFLKEQFDFARDKINVEFQKKSLVYLKNIKYKTQISVEPGVRVCVDGYISDGSLSSLCDESLPFDSPPHTIVNVKSKGDGLVSGTINIGDKTITEVSTQNGDSEKLLNSYTVSPSIFFSSSSFFKSFMKLSNSFLFLFLALSVIVSVLFYVFLHYSDFFSSFLSVFCSFSPLFMIDYIIYETLYNFLATRNILVSDLDAAMKLGAIKNVIFDETFDPTIVNNEKMIKYLTEEAKMKVYLINNKNDNNKENKDVVLIKSSELSSLKKNTFLYVGNNEKDGNYHEELSQKAKSKSQIHFNRWGVKMSVTSDGKETRAKRNCHLSLSLEKNGLKEANGILASDNGSYFGEEYSKEIMEGTCSALSATKKASKEFDFLTTITLVLNAAVFIFNVFFYFPIFKNLIHPLASTVISFFFSLIMFTLVKKSIIKVKKESIPITKN